MLLATPLYHMANVSTALNTITSTALAEPTVQTSPAAQPSILPCSDPSWAATPVNWNVTGVDQELDSWWNDDVSSQQKNSATFVGLLFNLSGNAAQQCGIGADSTCALPSCPEFQSTGLPKWIYFAQVSVVELSKLFNNMAEGMTAAESQMDPVIPNMADLFPWQNPQTTPNSAIPWIEGAVATVLSFIPVLGFIFGVGADASQTLSSVAQSATQFANGAVQQMQTDPNAQILGNIDDIGLQVEVDFKTARETLDSWAISLFDGKNDTSGKNIIDYMSNGRFTVNYNAPPPDSVEMAEFFFQVLASKFANDQYRNNSMTYVMCTNSSAAPCQEVSLYQTDNRTCCLYSLDSELYIEPPSGLDQLSNSTYSISPRNITASSLASYLAAGFNYTATEFYNAIDASATLNPTQQAFSQGPSFEGVWTLPVCDIPPEYGSWVANYSNASYPCCCGVGCFETCQFQTATGAASQELDEYCSYQYPGYIPNWNCTGTSWARSTRDSLEKQWATVLMALFWMACLAM